MPQHDRATKMSKHLVIVESPAKAKTLEKYLGKDFKVLASYGHVRDLVPKKGAVDPDHDFAMKYQLIEKNSKHVDEICQYIKKADDLYLATDPDREGEAISWHLYELLKERKLLKNKPVYRIVFHEITRKAVLAAVENPRELSLDLINAQQARRALDYLVGFNLSPLLWKKIRRGLSAGRVQSPALRMIAEREKEIEAFVPQEYWTIESLLNPSNQSKKPTQPFKAKLAEYQGTKIEQFSITDAKTADSIKADLLKQANGKLQITKINKSQRKRQPAAPFTTSTLQQEAIRKLGFTAQRAMRVAQQLYEGVDFGEGAVGLITYMRTDSVNLSEEALTSLRTLIEEKYGKESMPDMPRIFKTKAKNAQEAHEAVRPTMPEVLPSKVKSALTLDQFKLYDLIWKRAVASQMIHATLDLVAIDFSCGHVSNRFRANGSTLVSPGFMQVYQEGVDDSKPKEEDEERLLPPLKEGEWVYLENMENHQHFTEPPPSFTEASLVKTLEEHGIGRPSTYATIISTLQQREYVTLETKRFRPTDVGKIVNKFLTEYFTQYVDYDFTAKLEDSLDSIAAGEQSYVPLMHEFWAPFIKRVEDIQENVQRKDVTQEALEENCPKCEKPLSIRLGRRGRFIGCTGYPDCDYTRSLEENREESLQPQTVEGRVCPKCESTLIIKRGKYGKFIGCSGYPDCDHMESLQKQEDTHVTCPECNKGTLIKRKSRFGTFFYACNQYPECKYAIKNPPVLEKCPTCDWPILTIKTTKRRGVEKVCPQKECDYAIPYEETGTEG
jgi:DNA topoisomerase-1